jgi:hypothetical protein
MKPNHILNVLHSISELGRSGLTPHHSYPGNASFKDTYSNLKPGGLDFGPP